MPKTTTITPVVYVFGPGSYTNFAGVAIDIGGAFSHIMATLETSSDFNSDGTNFNYILRNEPRADSTFANNVSNSSDQATGIGPFFHSIQTTDGQYVFIRPFVNGTIITGTAILSVYVD